MVSDFEQQPGEMPVLVGDTEGEPNVIVMQSTGFEDKNGKTIFEGDIVSGVERDGVILDNCVVVFRDGCFCLDGNTWPMLLINMVLEVVGNIYETPEFLTNAA